jgi:cytochrome c oxidase subunit 2
MRFGILPDRIAAAILLAGALGFAPLARADWALNMTKGVTPLSREIYDLHMLILWICVAIGVVVFSVMFASIILHRKSRGAVAVRFHHSTYAEMIWTIIPAVILVSMAIPATRTLIAMESTGDAELTIKVTGYQWKWHYDYIEDGIDFFSSLDAASNEARARGSGIDPRTVEHYLLDVDQRAVVPINTKIRFLTTAADVIHAWWVPDLGWKRDAIPGFINESWAIIEKPGVYRGQCAELCGKDHGFMPVVLEAVGRDRYLDWVQEMKAAQAQRAAAATRTFDQAELLAMGEEVYGKNCVACHQANGQGLPPAFPSLVGSPITTGPLAGHLDMVLNGKPGTAMAPFGPQLNDAELAAVLTYERNAWGNDTRIAEGTGTVQPADVKAARSIAAE